MKRYHENLIVPLALLLAPYLIVAWSWGPAVPFQLAPAKVDGKVLWHPEFQGADGSPFIHAIDPVEARQRMLLYVELHRPPMHQREAVLPNPSDGRELVDRYVAAGVAAHKDKAVSHVTNHLRPPLRG